MKKIVLCIILMLLSIPCIKAQAADYSLKSGETAKGIYAGEDDYNYYRIKASKDGYIEIKANTSNKQPLTIDICNEDRSVAASDISIINKKSVLHKVAKGKVYYLRIKGELNQTFSVSYKINTFSTPKYAKKYSYTFTNASFTDKKNAILIKIKSNKTGVLNFMCNTNDNLMIQYLDSKKKVVSKNIIANENHLSGIGVKSQKIYYVRIWNLKQTISGTTSLQNIKYQIKDIYTSDISTRARACTLYNNKYKEAVVPCNQKSIFWYKIKTGKDQKVSITIESRMLQNSGLGLQMDLYNVHGKKITDKSIVINDEAFSTYNKKKYVMHYPKKVITTGVIPKGTYYVRIVNTNKKNSGSFRIKWK